MGSLLLPLLSLHAESQGWHRQSRGSKPISFNLPWHIWILADTRDWARLQGAGFRAALQESVPPGRETARLWGRFRRCIRHPGGPLCLCPAGSALESGLGQGPRALPLLTAAAEGSGQARLGRGGPWDRLLGQSPSQGPPGAHLEGFPPRDPAVLAPSSNSRKTTYCLEDSILK